MGEDGIEERLLGSKWARVGERWGEAETKVPVNLGAACSTLGEVKTTEKY